MSDLARLHERIVSERRAGTPSLWTNCPEHMRDGWLGQARELLERVPTSEEVER
jgi:hypothetical protein